eukprot:gene22684-28832_t
MDSSDEKVVELSNEVVTGQDDNQLSEKLRKLTGSNPRNLDYLNRRALLGVDEGNSLEESRLIDEQARARKVAADLAIVDGSSQGGKKREKRVSAPKRMANPFSTHMTPPIDPSFDWSTVYASPALPMHIDVGCAKGRCIARLSQKADRAGWNHLGLEIRDSLVVYSKEVMTVEDRARKNLHFLTNNFAASAVDLFATLPKHCVRLISFQFPDPWRRLKHSKRLIIQPKLISTLSANLSAGACIYLSSDCDQIAERMKRAFMCDGSHASQQLTADLIKKDEVNANKESVTKNEVTAEDEEGESSDDEEENEVVLSNNEKKSGRHNTENFAQYFTLLEDVFSLYPNNSNNDTGMQITENCFPGKPKKGSVVADKDKSVMSSEWIRFNPLDEPSERELVCEMDWKRWTTSWQDFEMYTSEIEKAATICKKTPKDCYIDSTGGLEFTDDSGEAYQAICALTPNAKTPIPDYVFDGRLIMLNIGGMKYNEGWLLVNSQADSYHFATNSRIDIQRHMHDLVGLPSHCVSAVYSSHTLEHNAFGDGSLEATLKEWYRVLRPGGLLMVSVPDLETLARMYLDPLLSAQRWMVTKMMYGAQFDEFDYHKVGFDLYTLTHFLEAAGFCRVERVGRFNLNFDDTSDMIFHGYFISLNVVAQSIITANLFSAQKLHQLDTLPTRIMETYNSNCFIEGAQLGGTRANSQTARQLDSWTARQLDS